MDEKSKDDLPDSGLITEEEKARFQTWWDRFGKDLTCPVCRSKNWTIYNRFVTPVTISGAKRNSINLSTVHPSLALTCGTCANTIYINALTTGVMERPKEPGGES